MQGRIRAKNVALIMSGGVGSRFGADKPKQYCNMLGRPIIEFAFDACRHASSVDAIVVVAAADYMEHIRDRYGFPVTCGGDNRTKSLANGLKYIALNYDCENVIVANAVCPLMTSEQINRYFSLLDEYDYVLTAWKVTSTLAKYDGSLVDRNDYFHVMEPEAYKFKTLYAHYDADYPVPYIFHQMPRDSRAYYCFDYPYTMKITYAMDVKLAEVLYKEMISTPEERKTKLHVGQWQASFGGGYGRSCLGMDWGSSQVFKRVGEQMGHCRLFNESAYICDLRLRGDVEPVWGCNLKASFAKR